MKPGAGLSVQAVGRGAQMAAAAIGEDWREAAAAAGSRAMPGSGCATRSSKKSCLDPELVQHWDCSED